MEVHHHSHHEGKKNWKSYFWEFLMLFLAVFCGFLAEYQLEHTIEHEREKRYIRSLISDIKSDTTNAETLIKEYQNKLPNIDSLIHYFQELLCGNSSNFLKYEFVISSGYSDFYYSDGTMQQLKNSGGLRLIKGQNVSDSIISYDLTMRDVLGEQSNMYELNWMPLWKINYRIFDTFRIDSLKRMNANENITEEKLSFLLTNDRQQLVEYYSNIKILKANILSFIDQLKSIKSKGEDLINFLNKEYHFQ
jgi:hypothetical protein